MPDTQTTAPALTIKRTFDAPRERVFAAFTNAELLHQWFGPPQAVCGTVTMDAREGGRYRIQMKNSEGVDYNAHGTITECREPERLAYTFQWEEDDASDEHETFVTIDFIDRGKKTEMIFTQSNLASEASRDGHTRGWHGSFDKLATLLG